MSRSLSRRCRVFLGISLLGLAACKQPPAPPVPPDSATIDDAGPDIVAPDQTVPDRGPGPDRLKGPPYPIVFAHGFFGFTKIGPIEYWYHVKPALEAAGHKVVMTAVDPFNGSLVRGEQLLKQVKDVLDLTGAAKVNIVAHSQGGLDARYVASKIPSRVAAVFTVATPHLGCGVADAVLKKAPGFSVALLQAVCQLAGRPFWGDIAKDPDLEASMASISSEGTTAFNQAYPDVEGIKYYSVGGRTNLQLAEKECEAPKAPPFVSKLAGERDPTDATLLLTAAVLAGSILDPEPNDGMVQVNSTKWGTWLGCIPADHMDEIGQYFGDSPGVGNSFNHIQFYKDVAAFLVGQGF